MLYVGPGVLTQRYVVGSELVAANGVLFIGPAEELGDVDMIHEHMKFIGKQIYVWEMGTEKKSAYEKRIVSMARQTIPDGDADEYPRFHEMVLPAANQLRQVQQAVEKSVPGAVKVVTDYIRHVMSADYGLTSNVTAATVLAAFSADLSVNAETVLVDGKFDAFFTTVYGVTLPTDNPATIDDAWVTADYVPDA